MEKKLPLLFSQNSFYMTAHRATMCGVEGSSSPSEDPRLVFLLPKRINIHDFSPQPLHYSSLRIHW